jgi:hypothetical protein
MDRADQRTLSVFSAEYLEVKLHFILNVHGAQRRPPKKEKMTEFF